MKILFFLILGFSFTACNSGSGETLESNSTGNAKVEKAWSNEDQISFMDDCITEAEKTTSSDSAQKYCACVLLKAQAAYADYETAEEKMTKEQIDGWTGECLEK